MIAPAWLARPSARHLMVLACVCGCAASAPASAQLPVAQSAKPVDLVGARQPALSSDGKWLAFSLHGDIWRCALPGGVAERITVHPSYDGYPAWSPDGKWIAFSSGREGNYDVYVTPAGGGTPRRLTQHPRDDFVCDWSPDGSEVLFESDRDRDPSDLYGLSVRTGIIRRITSEALGARHGRYSADGAIIVFSTGNREWWQARYMDGAFSEIRSVAATGGPSKPIAEGRSFVGMPGVSRNRLFWVEGDGTGIGVRSGAVPSGGGAPAEMVTRSPISWLACARGTGLLVIERDGRLWSRETDKASEWQVVNADARSDTRQMPLRTERQERGFRDLSVSPDGKRLAFVAGGDVWTAPIDGGDATRLSATAGPEMFPTWSPDAKRIAYVAVRNEQEDLFEWDVENRKETQLTDDSEAESEPKYAPDGRRIAYIARARAGAELRVLYLDAPPSEPIGNRTTLAVSGQLLGFDWSPDGRWLVYSASAGPMVHDLYAVPSVGGTGINITRSAGHLEQPVWSRNGAMVAAIGALWSSDGSRARRGVVVVDLQSPPRASSPSAPPGMAASETPTGLESEEPVSQRPRRGQAPRPPGGPQPTPPSLGTPWPFGPAARPPDRVVVDLERAHTRVRPLAPVPGSVEAMTFAPDGRSLALTVSSPDGSWIAGADSLSSAGVRLASVAGASRLAVLPDGSAIVLLDGDGVMRILRRGSPSSAPVNVTCTYDTDRRQVVREAVAHLWREVRRRASDGDWAEAEAATLRRTSADVAIASDAPEDRATALLATVGQVGQTVRDARLGRQPDRTGFLGLEFDSGYTGPGLRIARVLPRGPAHEVENGPGVGEYVHSVNDVACNTPEAVWAELRGLAGRVVRIVVAPTPPSGDGSDPVVGKRTVNLRAVSGAEARLLRDRDLEQANEARVEQLSSGTCRYIRLRGFDASEARRLASALITDGDAARSAIVDIRDLRTDDDPRPVAELLMEPTPIISAPIGVATNAGRRVRVAIPVVLMVNERTAGTSEVLAGVLGTSMGGQIVGAPTAGWNRAYRPHVMGVGVTVDIAHDFYEAVPFAASLPTVVKPTGPSIRASDEQLTAAVDAALKLGELNTTRERSSPPSS